MERLTQTSDKGGVAFTFDLTISCEPNEAKKILKVAEKLKQYEDLEEQGLLLRLPCKVGDTIYVIENSISKMRRIISDYEVVFYSLDFSKNYIYCTHHYGEEESESRTILIEEIGKTAFLTLAEAEAKLKEMEENQ